MRERINISMTDDGDVKLVLTTGQALVLSTALKRYTNEHPMRPDVRLLGHLGNVLLSWTEAAIKETGA